MSMVILPVIDPGAGVITVVVVGIALVVVGFTVVVVGSCVVVVGGCVVVGGRITRKN